MHECKTVTLRTRPLKGRMMSFYLDYYPGYRDKETMKVIRHESLGIYIYANPRNKREQSKFFIYHFFCFCFSCFYPAFTTHCNAILLSYFLLSICYIVAPSDLF